MRHEVRDAVLSSVLTCTLTAAAVLSQHEYLRDWIEVEFVLGDLDITTDGRDVAPAVGVHRHCDDRVGPVLGHRGVARSFAFPTSVVGDDDFADAASLRELVD